MYALIVLRCFRYALILYRRIYDSFASMLRHHPDTARQLYVKVVDTGRDNYDITPSATRHSRHHPISQKKLVYEN